MIHARQSVALLILAASAAAAAAQMPSIPGIKGLGGMSAVPGISSMGAGNVAGVLGYCMENNLLGSGGGAGGAASVLQGLEKKPGVTSSKGFAAGKAGEIMGGNGSAVSLNSISGPAKSQACNMVLKQGHKML